MRKLQLIFCSLASAFFIIGTISKSTEHLVEEIADLYIVLSQLTIYYGPNRVDAIVEKKIARELKRINNNTMEV